MSDHGDLHNFGQYVRAVNRASGSFFQKPRTVYWEWLFFGQDSPLKPFFQYKSEGQSLSPAECLFNLRVEWDHPKTGGLSGRVSASPSVAIEKEHYYSLGVLLSYCYIFGIRDLHRHNVIKTKTHLQVIDAEVVMVDLFLPNETLLLPFKDVGFDLAACGLVSIGYGEVKPEILNFIFQGYSDTFANLIAHTGEIRAVFEERAQEMAQIPVRHIMRDTKEYRAWNQPGVATSFTTNEINQLERGDIPYFFKLIGDPALYEYTNAEGGFNEVPVHPEFEKAVTRDCTPSSILLDTKRIDRLFPTGLLFLAKRLLGKALCGRIDLGNATIEPTQEIISVAIGGHVYQATRV